MSCCNKIIAASEHVTACECAGPGYCARHKMDKPAHFAMLCRTNPGYFQQYESGVGPGQNPGTLPVRYIGVGDALAWLIRKLTFGRVTPCTDCKSRMAWLNAHFPRWRLRG